jgi:hypothetical protein
MTYPIEETKKGLGDRVAHIISAIASPYVVTLPLFLFLTLRTAPDILHALLWWIVIMAGISVLPFWFIRRGVKRGTYTDLHVGVRSQRLIPLSFALLCQVLVLIITASLLRTGSLVVLAALMTLTVALALAIVITHFGFKISVHLIYVTGAILICSLVFPLLFTLFPLVPLVGWARWKIHAHTPLQALAGAGLTLVVTVAVFWLFRLL